MCGFTGIAWDINRPQPNPKATVKKMSQSILHRGPNSSGIIESDFCISQFRRLSIIDLEHGHQPVSNEDKSIEAFLNGEIYNFQDLRIELEKKGHQFRSHSDAEIIPHLYEEYGTSLFSKLNGMFSICLFDHQKRKVFLARDHLGIKPLYFMDTEEFVLFGSELKAILSSDLLKASPSPQSVLKHIDSFHCPDPSTIVKNVEKVRAGDYLEIDEHNKVSICQFYRIPFAKHSESRPPNNSALRDLLIDSVDRQLVADVPVGISLSGGLDSSLLAACAAKSARSSEVSAFTVHFDGTPLEEVESATQIAKQFGLKHTILSATVTDFINEAPSMVWYSDEPIADPAFFAAMKVARSAAEKVTVILAGTGADELFAGYGHHRLSRKSNLARKILKIPFGIGESISKKLIGSPATNALTSYNDSRLDWHHYATANLSSSDYQSIKSELGIASLSSNPISESFDYTRATDPLNQQLYYDTTHYLRSQLLPLQDRTTMAYSIEGRVPFLDYRLVEAAFQIGGAHKLGESNSPKSILKEIASELGIPQNILNRKKLGFPNIVQQWFSGELGDLLPSILLSPNTYTGSHLPNWIASKVSSKSSIISNWKPLYSLLILNIWYEIFVNSPTSTAPQESITELFSL
jgi:asparagine synthase (glutamine-hydrolysing)